jgi:hypothetical protein
MYTLQDILPVKPFITHGKRIEMHLGQVHFLCIGVSAHKEKALEKTTGIAG